MLDRLAQHLEVSTTVAAILVALLALQLATQLYALVDLARRETVRGGRKWPWVVVVALGNLPGAIVYLAAGRAEPPAHDPKVGAGAVDTDAARRAVDVLYNPRDPR